MFCFCQISRNNRDLATLQSFIDKYDLQHYEYLFIIHISPHNCISCLHPLEHLNILQKRIDKHGNNTFIGISGSNDEMFWTIYNSFKLAIPFIPQQDLELLQWPNYEITPYCYFFDLTENRLIYSDKLPKEQTTFLALIQLIEKYSGVMF
jgi:hypothetical protein